MMLCPNLGDKDWLTSRTIVRLTEHPIARETMVQALRIGEVGLVGLPGEVFVEIGMAIKQQSPFKQTLVGELANDEFGYIPTPQAFEEGSYEVYTTASSPETGPMLIETAVGLLRSLAG
jgi:hypothetical protein